MAFVDLLFTLRRVSCAPFPSTSPFSDADPGMLGADLQSALLPVAVEIRRRAAAMRGDVYRAAMQLLTERQARNCPLIEQHLVVTALRHLQMEQDGLREA